MHMNHIIWSLLKVFIFRFNIFRNTALYSGRLFASENV